MSWTGANCDEFWALACRARFIVGEVSTTKFAYGIIEPAPE